MRKKDMRDENEQLHNAVYEQGRAIVGLSFRCNDAEAECEALIEDIRMLGRMGQNICPVCAHYNHGEGSKKCITCPKMDNFEWRGVVKEG
jgi:hypothetical protein